MNTMGFVLCIVVLWSLSVAPTSAQPARVFVLGEGARTWKSGGQGIDPTSITNATQGIVDTTNTPGQAVDFEHAPGWISPLFFEEDQNISSRVLLPGGSIAAPNAGVGFDQQLIGTVNGDHLVAFERKPTFFEPRLLIRSIEVIMEFSPPVGVHRIRFYPRNTVVTTPSSPFQSDFMRGYELWVNPIQSGPSSPDALVARSLDNQNPVVDLQIPPQYVRFLRLKSIAEVQFEIDEIEVYGTGYLSQATYLTDLIDLGDRATIGPVRWVEKAMGKEEFSQVSVRVRTGNDETPILYQQNVYAVEGGVENKIGEEEVTPQEYFELNRKDQVPLREDITNWSPWNSLGNNGIMSAPGPRRFVQFQVNFEGKLFATRLLDRLEFEYMQPPIADTLRAEIFPRLAEAEKPATFRYAVQLRAAGPIRGFDRLEVDTNAPAERIREVKLNGEPLEFAVEAIKPEQFSLSFPLIQEDGATLEFTFDLPIFRFGTTFSGRVYNSHSGQVPQALEPGNASVFGPGDVDELSNLTVEIPKAQIGKLVGDIAVPTRLFSPNGDGINDQFVMFFNLLQLTLPVPVSLEIYDLAGRRVVTVCAQERGIGPVECTWDGRMSEGSMVPPGIYLWVLLVKADAFEEQHSGVLGVVY